MGGSEFLQGLYIPEPGHCTFSSPEWLMLVFGPVVQPSTADLVGGIADYTHGRPIRSEPIRNDHLGQTISFHGLLQESQCGLAIPAFRSEDFKNLALMIDGAPKVMSFAIDAHKHLIQVPTPV
jgi:hypothetical protein